MILDQNHEIPAKLSENAENLFYQMAEHMGILVTEEEAGALDRALASGVALNEMQNVVRLNNQAKLSSLTVRSALMIAQQKKDPLFAKYARAAELKRRIRTVIAKKYGAQAVSTARKLLANAGKRNLVDISQKSSSFSHPETRG